MTKPFLSVNSMSENVVVFDLDDTLYNEIDFLKSAYVEIANNVSILANVSSHSVFNEMLKNYYNGLNVFKKLITSFSLNKNTDFFLNIYRNHKPIIEIDNKKKEVLDILKSNSCILGLLTDGRSVQQRNKIKALGLESYFEEIIISEEFGSEKPNINNYKYFQNVFLNKNYTYIADNISKDFISANTLHWKTICLLDNGKNIHKQNFNVSSHFLPKYQINSFSEILELIN